MTAFERYADATREQLLAVVAAADARWRCLAEFGDLPNPGDACGGYEDAIDDALVACQGTSAQLLYQIVRDEESAT